MTIDKQKLKALAEAANAVTTDVNITMAVGADPVEVKAVQDYLQVAMPKTVLALLAEIENTESRLHGVATLCATVEQERDQLKAENEALRKDAERCRWLRDKAHTADWEFIGGQTPDAGEAEIDAAMAKEASHG